jgi:hypothetical protein
MQVFENSVALWLHLVNGTSGPRSSTKVHGSLCTLVTTCAHYLPGPRVQSCDMAFLPPRLLSTTASET